MLTRRHMLITIASLYYSNIRCCLSNSGRIKECFWYSFCGYIHSRDTNRGLEIFRRLPKFVVRIAYNPCNELLP